MNDDANKRRESQQPGLMYNYLLDYHRRGQAQSFWFMQSFDQMSIQLNNLRLTIANLTSQRVHEP